MKEKFCIFVLFIFFQFSCSKSDIKSETSNTPIPTISPTSQKTQNHRGVKPSVSEISVVYWDALGEIYYDNEHGKKLGSINAGTLVYKAKTIFPENLDQIENNQDIPQDLLNNFKAANQKTGNLIGEYPLVSTPILEFNGSRDLAIFYKEARSKISETKAVVCFSNIGFDNDYSDILVYAEYYRPEKGLIKFYYKISNLDKLLHMPIGADGNPEIANYQVILVD